MLCGLFYTGEQCLSDIEELTKAASIQMWRGLVSCAYVHYSPQHIMELQEATTTIHSWLLAWVSRLRSGPYLIHGSGIASKFNVKSQLHVDMFKVHAYTHIIDT